MCADPARYGDHTAPFYDQLYPSVEPGLLAALADLAGDGPVLDLGIGTGRVAIPLRRAGVAVEGIDASPAMIAALRRRAGAEDIPVILGDFASMPFGACYRLVYSLVSTLFLLPSLSLQRACLGNIARHLLPGGRFLCEAYAAPGSFPDAQSHEIPIATPGGLQVYRVTCLATPLTVLDAMAADVGLKLVERWRDWSRRPHTPSDARHISVYELASQAGS